MVKTGGDTRVQNENDTKDSLCPPDGDSSLLGRVGLLNPTEKETTMKAVVDFISCILEHARALGLIVIVLVLLLGALMVLTHGSIDATFKGLLDVALGAGVTVLVQGVTNANNREKENTKKDGGS